MSKDITPQQRKAKELGYKAYKVLLHIITIGCLWRMYVAITGEDEWWLVYIVLFLLLFLKHIEAAFITKKAKEEGILPTIWLEKQRDKKNKST